MKNKFLLINNLNSRLDIFLTYSIYSWFVILILIGLVVGYSAGDDYMGYMLNWERALVEKNPWQEPGSDGQINSYGPFHPLFSLFYYLNPLFPKLVYMMTFSVANLWVFNLLKNNSYFNNPLNIFLYFILIPFNFNIINYVYIFGHNDGFIAGLVICSLLTKIKEKYFLSACLLTISIMEKYYTGFLFPIFIINFFLKKEFYNLKKFLYSSAITFLIILAINKLLYNNSTLFIKSFFTLSDVSNFFSYISSVTWYLDLFKNRFGDTEEIILFLMKYNLASVIILYLAYLYFSVKFNINFYLNLIIALMIVLTFHKSSYMTYYISVTVIIAFLTTIKNKKLVSNLTITFLPYNVFLSIMSFSYLFLSDAFNNIFHHARNIMGFTNLTLSLLTIFFSLSTYFIYQKKYIKKYKSNNFG